MLSRRSLTNKSLRIQQFHFWAYIQRKWNYIKEISRLKFIAASFTIVKTWKHPKCPPTDEWIIKMWNTHTRTQEYYSAMRKKEILPFATTWMDLEGIRPSEIRERQALSGLTYMWKLKNKTKPPNLWSWNRIRKIITNSWLSFELASQTIT